MKNIINGTVIICGNIKKPIFSDTKEKAFVKFDDGTIIEFRNGKKARADHIKKLQLSEGEYVIAIGAVSTNSSLYIFGYDLKRYGILFSDDYYFLAGKVRKSNSFPDYSIIQLNYGEKYDAYIKTASSISDIKTGDFISCMCLSITEENLNPSYSKNSRKILGMKKRKEYIGLDLERKII